MKDLIKLFWENKKEIAEGIQNQIKLETSGLTPEQEEEIFRRRVICHECPFNSRNAENDGWYASDRPDEHCTMCLCNINLKTACLNCSCGIEAYNKTHKDKEELKWDIYEKSSN